MSIKKLAKYALIGIVAVIILHTVYNAYVSSRATTNAGQ